MKLGPGYLLAHLVGLLWVSFNICLTVGPKVETCGGKENSMMEGEGSHLV